MLLVFQMVFSAPIISRIESIGGVGRREQMESERRVKATIQTQRAVLCLQCVTQTDIIHKGGQDRREEQPGTPCSPINAPQEHKMHPCGFTASINNHL